MASRLGLTDDDWVWIESPTGWVKGEIRLVDGVNADTVWTWNAIGKRRGAWALKEDALESNRAFLLNHAIADLLPPDKAGRRYPNSDPVTGQAAWFDLRVRITKCGVAEDQASHPQFPPLALPPGFRSPSGPLRFGAQFSREDRT